MGRLCRLANVPIICPHSLRGLHATLALEGGATADSVAKALGHGSFAMTARHCTESSVLDAAIVGLFRPCCPLRFTDRVGSLAEGAPCQNDSRNSSSTIQGHSVPQFSSSTTNPRHKRFPPSSQSAMESAISRRERNFCGSMPNSSSRRESWKTFPLLLREKVREVLLPHWAVTKNLPTSSNRGTKPSLAVCSSSGVLLIGDNAAASWVVPHGRRIRLFKTENGCSRVRCVSLPPR